MSLSSFPVFVGGSRRASAPCRASARSLGLALGSSPLVSGLFVGCAGGVDSAVLSGWVAARGVSGVSLFCVGGASGAGFWGGSLPPWVSAFVARGGVPVWWAGGGASVSLSARLARRSRACVSGAVAGGAAFGVWLVSSPSSRGSFGSLAFAVGRGLPAFAVPFGFSSLPSVGSGRWVASSFLGGAQFLSTDANESNIDYDYLIPDLHGHDLPTWYKEMKQFKPTDIVPISRRRTAGRDLQHLVWITKYRKEILYGRIRDSIETSLRFKSLHIQVDILELSIMPDHVHVIIDKPKNLTISYIAQAFKGLSSRALKIDHPAFVDDHNIESALWAKRYFSCSVGSSSRQAVQDYVSNQSVFEAQ